MTPTRPEPHIVVHLSAACDGLIRCRSCEDCEDDDCEHECHFPEPTGDLRDRSPDPPNIKVTITAECYGTCCSDES